MSDKKLVGVVLRPNIPYFQAVIDGVTRYSLEKGHWIFRTSYGLPYLPNELVDRWQGDGLVGAFEMDTIRICRTRKIPAVSVSTSNPPQAVPAVTVDNRSVGKLAAEHLLSKGLRRFAVLAPRTSERFYERIEGFSRRIQAAGYTCEQITMGVRWRRGEVVRLGTGALRTRLRRLNGPTGLFTLHDYTARAVVETCQELGLRIPEDISLIGAGNWKYDCLMASPTLTSIDVGAERIGYQAAQLLDHLMAGGKWPKQPILLPPTCVVSRQSTDVLAVDDAEVREAVQFIRTHETEPIQMSDVLQAVPIGRRSLEMRFRDAVGRSVHDEIRRSRIAWACRMLLETDLPVVRIAENSAYISQDRFYVAFKRETGMTPLQYRRTHRSY